MKHTDWNDLVTYTGKFKTRAEELAYYQRVFPALVEACNRAKLFLGLFRERLTGTQVDAHIDKLQAALKAVEGRG